MKIIGEISRHCSVGLNLSKNSRFRRLLSPSIVMESQKLNSENNCTAHQASGKLNCHRRAGHHSEEAWAEQPKNLERTDECYTPHKNFRQRKPDWKNHENNAFYSMMQANTIYKKDMPPQVQYIQTAKGGCAEQLTKPFEEYWSIANTEQIIQALICLCQASQNYPVQSVTPLFKAACQILESPPDDKHRSLQFLSALASLNTMISNNVELYPRVSIALNLYCKELLPFLHANEIFLALHCYRLIGDSGITWQGSFPERALVILDQQIFTLSQSQLVQLCYFISSFRKPVSRMNKLQRRIENNLESMTIGELTVVISAFFKTNIPINSPLMLFTIIKKAKQNPKNIEQVSFTTIWKSLRFHEGTLKRPVLVHFLKYLQFDKMMIPSLSHLLHYATVSSVYDETLMQEIRNRVTSSIQSARLKDVTKFMMYVSKIGYSSEHVDAICQVVTEHFKRTLLGARYTEFKRYPLVLASCLTCLSYLNKYDAELTDMVLSESFLSHLTLELKCWWDIWYLDRSIVIDLPWYDGSQLRQSHRYDIAKVFEQTSISGSDQQIAQYFRQFMLAVAFTLKSMFVCTSSVLVGRVLPQYNKSNIIVCLDKASERGIPIERNFLPDVLIEPRAIRNDKSSEDVRWLVFELLPTAKVIAGTSNPIGVNRAKLRHLQSLGYIPRTILQSDWDRRTTETERISYLRELISNRNRC